MPIWKRKIYETILFVDGGSDGNSARMELGHLGSAKNEPAISDYSQFEE